MSTDSVGLTAVVPTHQHQSTKETCATCSKEVLKTSGARRPKRK